MSIPAIFLDRDGTINIDRNFVHRIDDFHFIDGVIDACKALKSMGFALVIVTNQSGIARNLFSEADFLALTEWMDWSLADRGVELDGIYYCPHLPDADCECRKPGAGMLLNAAEDLDIDLSRSFMVGDKLSDLQAGRRAGVFKTVFVKSGQAITPEIENEADLILNDLSELPQAITATGISIGK